MSALRDAAMRIAAMGRFPVPDPDRKLACEKVATRLEGMADGRSREAEPWDDFLRRIGVIDG